MNTHDHAAVECRGLTKTYANPSGPEVIAVRDISLQISKGDVVLICGPNGSGKTTLLSLIGCLLQPTAGSIRVLGQETTELSQKKLSLFRLLNIGFVFQHFRLLESLTALENVELPLNLAGQRRPESLSRARRALEEMGVGSRADFLPSRLSGGERQRVAIARAFVNTPDLILADEPTGNLDSRAGRQAVDLLCGTARREGRTVVIVSHDERIRPVAGRVIRMEDGRAVEEEA
jgi:putative ABC transport system ATP-binding protein